MTTPSDRAPPKSPFENTVFYNLRYSGISSSERLEWRRKNLAYLCDRHAFVCISELRNSDAVVESSLFSHLPTHQSFYHCGPELPGQAILVQRMWAATVGVGDKSRLNQDWGHEVLVSGCMHMMWWVQAGVLRGVINMYLDSHSTNERVRQIREAATQIHAFKQKLQQCSRYEFVFGGDRNFTTTPEQRLSSDQAGNWFPGSATLQAWSDLMEALGSGTIIEQSEFTWQRISTTANGERRFCKKVLDVAGTSLEGGRYVNFTAQSVVVPNMPYPHASDHQPVSLKFQDSRRAKPARERGAPRIPFAPEWLLDDEAFSKDFLVEVESWRASRPNGLAGIESFNRMFVSAASTHLQTKHVLAKSPQHQFDILVALLARMQANEGYVSTRSLEKWLASYPQIGDVIEIFWDFDSDEGQDSAVLVLGEHRLRDLMTQLLGQIVEDNEAANAAEENNEEVSSGSTQTSEPNSKVMDVAKGVLRTQMERISTLWDDHSQDYQTSRHKIASILKTTLRQRQGTDNGEPSEGQEFLRDWSCDLSECRQAITRAEMMTILLDTPRGKAPGPNGVPGLAYKRYAKQLAPSFLEALAELQAEECEVPASLGQRIGKVMPKIPGANTVSQIRDLELPNEHRKILARALAKVVGEVATDTMTGIQQAFLPKRDIADANIAAQEAYYRAVERNRLKFWLLLDCSKGYNNMSWKWVRAVMRAAHLPDGIFRATMRIMECSSEVIFIFDRLVCAPVVLSTGLPQGCPLSCILYVLAVDGMLEYVSRKEGVDLVIAFCDDWSLECEDTATVQRVQRIIRRFERSSGQKVNTNKSKILPTLPVDERTVDQLQEYWPDCPVNSNAKILGLYLGYSLTAEDYYNEVESRYISRQNKLKLIPMSMPMRILVLNTFVRSLLSYVGRFVLLPPHQTGRIRGVRFVIPVESALLFNPNPESLGAFIRAASFIT